MSFADAFAAKLRSSLQPEDDRPIVDQTADTLGIDFLFAVDIRSWFIKEFQFEIPVFKILGEQQLLPTELLLRVDPNDKSPTRKPNPQTDSSPKKAVPAERSRAKAQTAVENDGDCKSAATRAESGSKKAEAVTRPSVQWQVPVKFSTKVNNVHNKSFPGKNGGLGHDLYPQIFLLFRVHRFWTHLKTNQPTRCGLLTRRRTSLPSAKNPNLIRPIVDLVFGKIAGGSCLSAQHYFDDGAQQLSGGRSVRGNSQTCWSTSRGA